MSIVIAGGHGRVALMVSRLLADRGDRVLGIIRRPEQSDAVRAAGARPCVSDLAATSVKQFAQYVDGAQAVLFAAGAGLGDAPGRANPVDHDAIVALADAAELVGVRRFVMLSVMGADPARHYLADPLVETFLRARGRADEDLLARCALSTTVVRPAWFRDRPGTGRVSLSASTGPGEIPRADVAAVLAALLTAPATTPRVVELISGPLSVAEAVNRIVPPPPGA
ncbi:NAD-dependent epimerase/dehydratase [Streptomyces sp. W007]|uniref:NAD(P)H-binding protein n=1 Tax=Streptomyces sp. W007 TaxID=1055352 RepID=UPI0002419E3A|nr:NAD(P)H-binding protein [Streptomyces sp. W007]EHM30427.1 NAD-dependent epimerase/dehydratase [Streptomyces sp. W007]